MGSQVGVCETEMGLAHLFFFIIIYTSSFSCPLEYLSVGEGDVAKVITGLIIKNSWFKNFLFFFFNQSRHEGLERAKKAGVKMPPITNPGCYHAFTQATGLKMELILIHSFAFFSFQILENKLQTIWVMLKLIT